jgi:Plasmid pRiA4b ORF-3-like protein
LPDILSTVRNLPITRRRIRNTEEQELGSSDNRTLSDVVIPHTRGALRSFDWPKAPRVSRLAHGPRANHRPGAVLAALQPPPASITRFGGLCAANAWRSATPPRSRRHAGRTEDESASGIKAGIMGKAPRKAEEVISLKVMLRGIRPPIWRRLEVPSQFSLAGLHDAIQAAIGWEGRHVYVFDVAGRRYGNPAAVDDVADDERLTVGAVLKSDIGRFTYTYDFGDDWKHDIVIEGKKAAMGGRVSICLPSC